ncbi:nuclear mitotic apparatus protein 1-like [Lingula anatina]|uniref:Nuclear mitotic apparatus protein 1-like n=1 Tax=Lingula anatina TaxID=7574 RepID=A0A1S3JRS5_LINAN|nr:nuclear mitotic apparatus protein 1-like [Lingula anatina]|eukprot:XP_013413108.1 nuclear mitotic apparatus protein 1-like [Lingula anatina]
MESPQLVHRRVLHQKELQIKHLESLLNTEIHLKTELQADLMERDREIASFDARCKEITHLQQQLQAAQDDLENMATLRENMVKMEKELARLRMQASSHHETEERNNQLEKENLELYKRKEFLTGELKHTQDLLSQTQGKMESLVKKEAQIGGTLEATQEELRRYQSLSSELKQQLVEVQKLYHEATMELHLAKENAQNAQIDNVGECMTVFTEKRIIELEEELGSSRTQVEKLKGAVETKTSQLEEADILANQKNLEIEHLKQEKVEFQQEMANLYQTLDILKASQAKGETEITKLHQEMEHKNQQMRDTEIAHNQHVREIRERCAAEMKEREKSQEQRVGQLHQEIESLKSVCSKADSQIRRLEEKLEISTKQMAFTEEQANQRVMEIEENYVAQMKEEQTTYQCRMAQLYQEVESLRSRLTKAETDNKQLQELFDDKCQEFMAAEKEASGKLQEFEEKYKDKCEELRTAEEQCTQRLTDLEGQYNVKCDELAVSQQQVAVFERQHEEMCRELEASEKRARESFKELERQFAAKCQELYSCEKQASERITELEEQYMSSLEEQIGKYHELTTSHEETAAKLAALEEQYEAKCNELDIVMRQTRDLEEQYGNKCRDLDAAKSEASEGLMELQKQYQAKCHELEMTEKQALERMSTMEENYSSKCQEMENCVKQAQEREARLGEEYRIKCEDLKVAQKQLAEFEVQYHTKCQELESVEKQDSERMAALEEQYQTKCQELETNDRQACVKITQLEEQYKTKCEEFETEISRMQSCLENKSQDVKLAELKLLEMVKEVNNVKEESKAEITRLQGLLEERSQHIKEIQHAADQKLLEKDEEMMNLSNKAKDKCAQIQELLENKDLELKNMKLLVEQKLQEATESYNHRIQIEEKNIQLEQIIRHLEENITTLKSTSDAQIMQLQNEIHDKKAEMTAKEIQTNQKVTEMESVCLVKVTKMEKSHKESMAMLQVELKTMKDNYTSAQSQVSQLRNILDTKTRVLKETEVKANERVSHTEEKYTAQLSKLETNFETLRDRHAQALGQIKTLQVSLEARGQQVKESELLANQKLCDMEQKYEGELRTEKERQQQRVEELEHEIEMLKADYAKTQDQLLNDADDKVLRYEEELEAYKHRVVIAENEVTLSQGKCKTLERELERVTRKEGKLITDQQAQLSQAFAMSKTLQSRLQQLEQEHLATRQKLASEERRCREVVEENERLSAAQRRQKEDGTVMKRLTMQVKSLEAQLALADTQLREYQEKKDQSTVSRESTLRTETTLNESMDCLDDSLEERKPLSLEDLRTGSSGEDRHSYDSTQGSSFTSMDHSFKHPMSLRSSHPTKRHSTTSSALGPTQTTALGAGSLFACAEEPVDMGFDWDSLSELQRRNTLCLPHLRSAYPLMQQPSDLSEDMMRSGRASASMVGDGLQRSLGASNTRKRHSGDRDNASDLKKKKPSKPSTPGVSDRGKNTPRRKSTSPRAPARTPRISRHCQENKTPKLKRQMGAVAFNIGFSPMRAPERRRGKMKTSQSTSTSTGILSGSQMKRKPLGNHN